MVAAAGVQPSSWSRRPGRLVGDSKPITRLSRNIFKEWDKAAWQHGIIVYTALVGVTWSIVIVTHKTNTSPLHWLWNHFIASLTPFYLAHVILAMNLTLHWPCIDHFDRAKVPSWNRDQKACWLASCFFAKKSCRHNCWYPAPVYQISLTSCV